MPPPLSFLHLSNMSDDSIISKLRAGIKEETSAIRFLYGSNQYRSEARRICNNHRIDRAIDYEDIFQEAISVLVTNVRKDGFRRESKLLNYFNGICWMIARKNAVQNKGTLGEKIVDFLEESQRADTGMLEIENEKELARMVEHMCVKVGGRCTTILRLKFRGKPNMVIANKVGVSPSLVAGAIYDCKQSLISFLDKNPKFTEQLKDAL